MKRFISISLILLFCLTVPVGAASNVEETYDIETLSELIAEQEVLMDAAHQMAESARILGYSEDHEVIQLAKQEYEEAKALKKTYEAMYDDLMEQWQQKEEEYPTAAYIWSYFKNLGYSDEVCAGILGNIMAEVGGNTLDIKWNSRSSYYYGICQWNRAYSEVWGASLEEQCDFLASTIEYELDTYGYAYKSGFNYDDFLSLTDPAAVAKAFAVCYERCGSGSYKARQNNAYTAYNYFTT